MIVTILSNVSGNRDTSGIDFLVKAGVIVDQIEELD